MVTPREERAVRDRSGHTTGPAAASSTPYATLNGIVVAQMPGAMVRMVAAANPGWRRSRRRP
ncbi:MAG: hypothetical protein ACM3SQ_09190 [Betaproteobacteria bacterium]